MSNYENQDRGDRASYQQYLEAMDAIAIEKVASASVFFRAQPGGILIDVGMASGTSTAILAKLFPKQQLIGVDINQQMVNLAQQKYQAPNLSFRVDDGETLDSFAENSVDGFFNCSAIHHITSYNGYNNNRAHASLERQVALLRVGGVLVIRDFVKPVLQEIILELSTKNRGDRPNDPELLILFSQQARALAAADQRGFPLEELPSEKVGFRRFKLFNTDAVEFIRRKDYYANWEIELQEEYAYFTQQEFESSLQRLGLRLILSAPIYNAWIIKHRYKDQFSWFDLSGKEIGFPPTNYIIAAEKVDKGTSFALIRHVAAAKEPFLQLSSYQHNLSGQVYDVVSRPNPVQDVLAYQHTANGLRVLAKQGYPRPIINALADPALDGKKFSGYIIEGITLATEDRLELQLAERFKLALSKELQLLHSYYTSPGAIDEKVAAFMVELDSEVADLGALQAGYSGFQTAGNLQAFDATQLLATGQTGALVEARLEMNLYLLFLKNNLALPPWLGEKIEVMVYDQIEASSLTTLLAEKRTDFQVSEKSADFIKINRAYFSEIGVDASNATLEYVIPIQYSANTLITLPVCRVKDQVYVGLELRSLPVPQLHEGNSLLLTVPAARLPKFVKNVYDLLAFLSDLKFGDSKIIRSAKLGEKYFPSIGISPEQVYPYVVCLDQPTGDLYWVSLSDVEDQLPDLTDAHLLICINRLRHALKDYGF